VLKHHSGSQKVTGNTITCTNIFLILGKIIGLAYFREDLGESGSKSCSLSLNLLHQMSSSAFAEDLYSMYKNSTTHH